MFTVSGKAPVTPGLRPGYDLPVTEKCLNRGQIVERTYNRSQRSWVIARAKSVAARSYVMLKPSHTGFTTRLRRSFDQDNLESYTYRRQIVERTYDWSQRSWVIARGKSVATRSMVMFKTCNLRFQIVSGRTISRATGRATLRPVAPPIDCSLSLYNVEMCRGFMSADDEFISVESTTNPVNLYAEMHDPF